MHSPFLPSKMRGLGDVVYSVAHPIAVVIDATSKAVGKPTNIQNCGRCKKTRADLNAKVPFGKH